MNPRLSELRAVRTDALQCVERAAETLVWFSKQFTARGTLPRNIWRQLDRPLPRETVALGRAFDLWHAVLRSEGALRNVNPRLASDLREQGNLISTKLTKLLDDDEPTKHDLVVRLAADEIYGTFNPFSAAAVQRSEIFPYRSAVTPSYLAGHILLSELKLTQKRALSYSSDGIREPAPRIAAVAEGVHSLMLYVEHLRARASHFRQIAGQLTELDSLSTRRKKIHNLPSDDAAKLEDAYVRIAVTAIAASCEQCDLLLLSTRPFFKSLDTSCGRLLENENLHRGLLLEAFREAGRSLKKDAGIVVKQTEGYHFALTSGYGLYRTIQQINLSLEKAFAAPDFTSLKKALTSLTVAAARLVRKHLGFLDYVDAVPSIADSARFGFIEDVITTFSNIPFRSWLRETSFLRCSRHGSRAVPSGQIQCLEFVSEESHELPGRLKELCDRYNLQTSDTDPCGILRALGRAPIGRSASKWWQIYSESYYVPNPTVARKMEQKSALADPIAWSGSFQEEDWLLLRHRSFISTQQVKRKLEDCKELQQFCQALISGANDYETLSNSVQNILKRLAQWCQSRGRDLLLAAQMKSGPVDPNELISALWVADRLDERWDDRSELDALTVIQDLQRKDGGFDPVEPLCQSRGFLFFPSSAQTISSLARFVTRGGTDSSHPVVQQRLRRWEKVLTSSTHFLTKEMIGSRDRLRSGENRRSGLAGWRTDRQPETDRIDCSVTIDATMALCRSVEAYDLLLNLEASDGFCMTWPSVRVSTAIPADSAAGHKQILPKLMGIVRDLQHRTGRYSPLEASADNSTMPRRSLLFYGPPGTGKTYFQQLIAGELRWPLIVLTIGDFLADGEDKVGARAVRVFQQLEYLSNACIVFDEFDEMVIQRSDKPSHSGFDLLTPAMLPLLAALRTHAETHNCLVTFTTNYVERLDRAAKRVGRVDEEIRLIYHDFTSRLLMFLKRSSSAKNVEYNWQAIEPVLTRAGLCAYPELRSFIDHNVGASGQVDDQSPRPAIDLDFYLERLEDSHNDAQVVGEALAVLESLGRRDAIFEIPGGTDLHAALDKVKQKVKDVDPTRRPVTVLKRRTKKSV